MGTFLSDLSSDDYQKCKFANYQKHHRGGCRDNAKNELGYYELYNWVFMNLNFTSIFDNCFDLNKIIFDPLPDKSS